MKGSMKLVKYMLTAVTCLTLLTFVSCKKINTRKLAGSYSCFVDYSYWEITPYYYDSTYNKTITIDRDKKWLNINGIPVHIDSLTYDETYMEMIYGRPFTVQFTSTDSLYTFRSSGGLGGGSSTSYACSKLD